MKSFQTKKGLSLVLVIALVLSLFLSLTSCTSYGGSADILSKDELLSEIRNTGVLSPERAEELSEAIKYCKDKFLNKL